MSEEKAKVELEQEEMAQDQAEQNEQAETEATETGETTDLAMEVERLQAQLQEQENRLLRNLADMDNMRRRSRKEQEDLQKYASQKVVESLLPALDNFERALAVDPNTATTESILQGVQMVYRQVMQVFEQEGLQAIESVGHAFDPHVHQAVMQVEDSKYKANVVVEELQKGYQFKDRVIRPAMVKVNA
ncbi:nucleotide exchange factor GrpE [Brevibacillus laterosporus]|uniref:Protein GrpE n=1 Tax=Brevibacillus laterosporus LMG 15441 TaxID=1042163 RepID=A0A075QZF9_BRELA|nr:nucleotide exchange factor GrpE [Brevibacillus laterosporus]AIG25732.1 molecular chaperone GrpE (heat shock protein) [Brevibacillus laterosporus LMG 15441]RJL08869.1 nucleotide exchange factor GrpE [Brevibacillus laterosporus]TPH13074.1 nucleotide exchange factor GrpE [Brevibacillus laterosporus]